MKNVTSVRGKDGAVEHYLRKPGLPPVRLPDGLDAAELERTVEALIAELSAARDAELGTLSAAIRAYQNDALAFLSLAPATRYAYRVYLTEVEQAFGDVLVNTITPAFVERLQTAWSPRGYAAANQRLAALKAVLRPFVLSGDLRTNPFQGVRPLPRPAELPAAYRFWSDATFATVMGRAISEQRFGLARALALARFAGARRADLVTIPTQARQGGRLRFLSGRHRALIDVPEDPRLSAWFARTPDRPPARPWSRHARDPSRPAPTTLVYTLAGRAYSPAGLRRALENLLRSLHRAGSIDSPRCDLRSLRHTRGVELVWAGCSDVRGAAMMGHVEPWRFAYYRRLAEQVPRAKTPPPVGVSPEDAGLDILWTEPPPDGRSRRRSERPGPK